MTAAMDDFAPLQPAGLPAPAALSANAERRVQISDRSLENSPALKSALGRLEGRAPKLEASTCNLIVL
jgi:hypothetical protein